MTVRYGLLIATMVLAGCTGPQVLNTLTPLQGYEVASNLVYDEATGQRLDIYAPQAVTRAPVVVFLFGGRWQSGAKDDFRFVGQALAAQGFIAVVPNYRLYPDARFPAFVHDAARAVAWTRGNIARYGGNPEKLFVMGHSSGAHIAALLATDDRYLRAAGGNRYWLRGMIGMAGPYDFLPIRATDLQEIFPADRREDSQPVRFVDDETPPLLLLHAEDDERVLVQNTRSLADAARRAGVVAVETVYYPTLSCFLGVDSHACLIAVLSSPMRSRSDVLAHIADFVRRWSEAPPREPPGPRVAGAPMAQ